MLTPEEIKLENKVEERLAKLQERAREEAEETHRVAKFLAEHTAVYYRELMQREVPESIAAMLVTAFHERLLGGKDEHPRVIYVPVPLSSSSG